MKSWCATSESPTADKKEGGLRSVRRILLVFTVFASTIIKLLSARVRAKARAREISSHESWQWGGLEEDD